MTRELAGLLAANALALAAGAGAIVLLGAATTSRELARRLGLAYLCGLAAVGIAAATLALVPLELGWAAVLLVPVALVVPALRRIRGWGAPGARRSRAEVVGAAAAALVLTALLARAWPVFVLEPLRGWDAWAIWTMKAHALLELGWADPVVFAGDAYRDVHLAYPLLLPALESLGFRAMGGFEPGLVHVQFLLFGVAVVGALAGLLYDLVPWWLLWPSLLAVATAPALLLELLTAYADVPLAAFVAAGVVAGGRWLLTGMRWSLAVAALLFAAALLTKFEAPLFVGAAFLGLALARARRGHRELLPLGVAAAAAAVPLVVWRLYVLVHDLDTGHTATAFHPGVGPIALEWLGRSILNPDRWGLVAPLFALSLALAFASRAYPLVVFALAATLLPLAGLVANYVVSPLPHALYLGSTADRVVSSIALAAAGLAPLLTAQALARHPSPSASASAGEG